MLSKVEKLMLFRDMQKLITSTCKTHYLLYRDRWDKLQKLAVCGFEGFEDISKFKKHFRKNHNENNDTEPFLEIDV